MNSLAYCRRYFGARVSSEVRSHRLRLGRLLGSMAPTEDRLDALVIHPKSKWKLAFDVFMMSAIMYTAMALPVEMCFQVTFLQSLSAFKSREGHCHVPRKHKA